jgi:Arc/MetJ family transcription regulator
MKRTTIEIDEELLERAKRALGLSTMRSTVEESLRLAAEQGEGARDRRAASQLRYLRDLASNADLDVLSSGAMWR